MKHFRHITHGKHIVMGYNTWKLLPDLPYRTSVVISRHQIPDVKCLPDASFIEGLEDALDEEVVVIGGAATLSIELLDRCSKIFHTTIKGTYEVDVKMSDEVMMSLKSKAEKILLDTENCIIREYV
jgi:dihydrofolate reductase